MFTGKIPFEEIRNDYILLIRIMEGLRPPRPTESAAPGLSNSMWEVMEKAWLADPRQRPSLSQISSVCGFRFATWKEVAANGSKSRQL